MLIRRIFGKQPGADPKSGVPFPFRGGSDSSLHTFSPITKTGDGIISYLVRWDKQRGIDVFECDSAEWLLMEYFAQKRRLEELRKSLLHAKAMGIGNQPMTPQIHKTMLERLNSDRIVK